MKRVAAAIVAIVFAVLTVGVAALWGRSYWCRDLVIVGYKDTGHYLASNRGTLDYDFESNYWVSPLGTTTSLAVKSSPARSATWTQEWLDSAYVGWNESSILVRIPHGVLLAMFATPSAIVVARLRRASQTMRNDVCIRCGYDVRCRPTRCPECGTPITSKPPASNGTS